MGLQSLIPGRTVLMLGLVGSGLFASSAVAAPRAADLAITSLTVAPATVAPGSTLSVSADLTNGGRASAESVVVNIWLAGTAQPSPPSVSGGGTALLGRVTVGSLQAGKALQIRQSFSVPSSYAAGSPYVHAHVTTSSSELSLTNNVRTQPVSIATVVDPATVVTATSGGTGSELKYQEFFDRVLTTNSSTLDAWAADGGTNWHYRNFQHVIMGTLSMFEATREPAYLERALRWIETMMSKASIVDRQGFRNWPGLWADARYTVSGTSISYHSWDLQAATEFARAVRIIKTDPALGAAYGTRADAIMQFVHNHIVKKLLIARNEEWSWGNQVTDVSRSMEEEPVLAISVLADMHRAGAKEFRTGKTYGALAQEWLTIYLTKRISAPTYNGIAAAGAVIWDFKKVSTDYSWDTDHANHVPDMLIRAHDAGIVVPASHIEGVARLFARVVWDRSTTAPRFTNYADGDNREYRTRGPWTNGKIYAGWVDLGQFDADALRAGEAMLDCIIAGSACVTPSKVTNDTLQGHLALAGKLMRAKRRLGATLLLASTVLQPSPVSAAPTSPVPISTTTSPTSTTTSPTSTTTSPTPTATSPTSTTTSPTSTATSPTSTTTSPTPTTTSLKYRAEFDRVFAANKATIDSLAASGLGKHYYNIQYALEPTISMWIATRDTKYLHAALQWAETMVSKATIRDSSGYLNWGGEWSGVYGTTAPIAFFLEEIQGSTGLARLAAVTLNDPAVPDYHARAARIRDFVRTHIVEKNFSRGYDRWCRDRLTQTTAATYDKPALFGTIVLWLSTMDKSTKYVEFARDVVTGYLAKLKPYRTGLAWDLGLDHQGFPAVDTAHANRVPALLDHARRVYGSSGAVNQTYLEGLAGLVTGTLWNRDKVSPMFANFIDGSNGTTTVFACQLPNRCGSIYAGWVQLAAYNAQMREVSEAVMDAILAGTRNNSLDFMSSNLGRLSMTGHLSLVHSGR